MAAALLWAAIIASKDQIIELKVKLLNKN